MRISDWSSDVCSSDLLALGGPGAQAVVQGIAGILRLAAGADSIERGTHGAGEDAPGSEEEGKDSDGWVGKDLPHIEPPHCCRPIPAGHRPPTALLIFSRKAGGVDKLFF